MLEEIIDKESITEVNVPTAVKVFSIISIVGSGLWTIILLLAMIGVMNEVDDKGNYIGGAELLNLIYIIFVVMMLLNVLSIFGTARLLNGRRGGYILYAIANGIWVFIMLLTAYSLSVSGLNQQFNSLLFIVSAVLSIGFIIALGTQLKNMPVQP